MIKIIKSGNLNRFTYKVTCKKINDDEYDQESDYCGCIFLCTSKEIKYDNLDRRTIKCPECKQELKSRNIDKYTHEI